MADKKVCDIIIPVWNKMEVTKECLEAIFNDRSYPFRVIVIDNGSEGQTRVFLDDFAKSHNEKFFLVRNENNEGYVKAVNHGMKLSTAPYVAILNNDTVPGKGWLSELISFVEKDNGVGLANPLCKGHESRGMSVDDYAAHVSGNKGLYMEMNQCQGYALLIKREVIDKIGYLDERFGLGGFDDTDYSMRAHLAGYKCVCVYSSYVFHKEHVSFNAMGDRKAIQLNAEKEYFKKWPRHLRIALFAGIGWSTRDEEIVKLLHITLEFAREWCWVNVFLSGDRALKTRVERISRDMGFPLHQNIKMNYRPGILETFEAPIRILERAFGAKARKKYDAVLCAGGPGYYSAKAIGFLTGVKFFKLMIGDVSADIVKKVLGCFRKPLLAVDSVKCDIILPVCNQYEYSKECIESIRKHTDTPYRLIVINNGTNPETRKMLDALEHDKGIEVKIIHNSENIGWVKALNLGMSASDAPYVCFQNDDTVVTKGWLKKLINILKLDGRFGLVTPEWEGRPDNVSIDEHNAAIEKNAGETYIETDWCRGFCVVIKRSVIEKIGPVDQRYGLGYFDDVDYSVTASEAGFRCLKALNTYVHHHKNVTASNVLKDDKWTELHEKNKHLYYAKWGRPLKLFIAAGKNSDSHDTLVETALYLARKQHRVHILSSQKGLEKAIRHTNVSVKAVNGFLMPFLVLVKLFDNAMRREEKHYDAVFLEGYKRAFFIPSSIRAKLKIFISGDLDFDIFVKSNADRLKEETKKNDGQM